MKQKEPEVSQNDIDFSDANKLEYNFIIPQTIFKSSKCSFSGRYNSNFGYTHDEHWNPPIVYISKPFRNPKFNKFFNKDIKLEKKNLALQSAELFDIPQLQLVEDYVPQVDITELIENKNKNSIPFSFIKRQRNYSNLAPVENKRIIQIDESDALCYTHIKKSIVTDSAPAQIAPQVLVKLNGLFKKFSLIVQDSKVFLDSIQLLVNDQTLSQKFEPRINFDSTPIKLLVKLSSLIGDKLESFHSSIETCLVFDLDYDSTLFKSFYLNTEINNAESIFSDELFESNTILHLAELISNKLAELLNRKPADEDDFKVLSTEPVLAKSLIGKVSYTDVESLNAKYSAYLNSSDISFNKTSLFIQDFNSLTTITIKRYPGLLYNLYVSECECSFCL